MSKLLSLAVLVLLAGGSSALAEPVNKSALGGIAVEGHDVVAYFREAKPVEGAREITHRWNDATWRFASAENRDLFAADPRKYAPQYGGYCAYGMSRGYAVGIDPKAWAIVDGRLYLNYSLDVQALWQADVPGLIAKADANWRKMLEESATR